MRLCLRSVAASYHKWLGQIMTAPTQAMVEIGLLSMSVLIVGLFVKWFFLKASIAMMKHMITRKTFLPIISAKIVEDV